MALISEPVGGLGKIILIKHKESVISIYGRINEIKVVKGERVKAGQVIGNVEKSFINEDDTEKKQNYLHFELRKGTESLDPDIGDFVREYIEKYKKNNDLTILLASHNMKEVERLCNKIVMMKKGEVVDSGTCDQLIKKHGRQNLEDTFLKIARSKDEVA